jgi:hypothetical protein
MNQVTVSHIEHLVIHHLTHHIGEERVFFHCKVNIERIRDDRVLGDILYHDLSIEGADYYPHTNINKVVYENCADLKYVLLPSEEEKSSDVQALNIAKRSSRELAIEGNELGEWEFECFLAHINKEECGQFLVEAYGNKESIAFLMYPQKLHYFIEDAFDTYVLFERLLDKTMQKYGF